MRFQKTTDMPSGMSRRGFLKGALLGGAALSMSARLALAQQMMTGRTPSIEEIHGAGVEPGLVRMNLNENPLGPSPRAVQAVAEHMFEINRYGTQERPLVEALAAFDGVELPARGQGPVGMGAGNPQQAQQMQQMQQMAEAMGMDMGMFGRSRGPYLITAGSTQALDLLALASFSREGGDVVEAQFGYGSVSRTVQSYKRDFGVETRAIAAPMTKGYKHDLDAMLSAITPNTKMVVITNPNNPTGTLLSYEEIERFVNKVPEHVIVLIDEAYIHFVEQDTLPSAIPLAASRENVAVVRTFSKVYAMPAMRLGYCVSSQKTQQDMRKYMTGSSNMLANVAGTEAVKDLEHVQKSRQAVWDFKKRCYEEFEKMGLEYIPSQGTFVMVNLGREARPIVMEMGRRRVRVSLRRDKAFKNWIRVSAGTMPETEVFLKTLKDVMGAAS